MMEACMQTIPGAVEQSSAGEYVPKVACGVYCTEAAAAAVAADGAQEPTGPQGTGVLLMVPFASGAA